MLSEPVRKYLNVILCEYHSHKRGTSVQCLSVYIFHLVVSSLLLVDKTQTAREAELIEKPSLNYGSHGSSEFRSTVLFCFPEGGKV